MKIKILFIFFLSIFFSACSTINSAQNGTLYYNSNSFNATLTSTGYGKNSNLLKNYSEGEFQNIFSEDDTFFKFKTNTTDSTGSSTNSVTIKIDFPQKKYVKSLKTSLPYNVSGLNATFVMPSSSIFASIHIQMLTTLRILS